MTEDPHSWQLGKALQTYEFLARDALDHIPAGSRLFGAPDQLRERLATTTKRSFSDIFKGTSKFKSMEYELTNWQQYTMAGESATAGGNYILNTSLEFRELDRDGREYRARKSAFAERLAMALFGGLSLIVPMLIMVMSPTRATALATTSVAVVLFASCVAVAAPNAAGKDVLAATAAYAAVLVVFVGTSAMPTPA